MIFVKQGLSLALLGAGLAAVPAVPVTASPASPASPAATAAEPSLVQQLKAEAQGAVSVSTEPATGRVGFVRARTGDLLPSVGGESTRSAATKATAYLEEYGAAFGVGADQLEQRSVDADDQGWTVDYAQVYRGVEVFGSKIRAHVDDQGDLTSVNGFAAPGLQLSTKPGLSVADAAARAVATVRARPANGEQRAGDPTGLEAASTELQVYRMGSTRGAPGEAVLAYVVEVTNEADVRDTVILDATTGKTLNRWSMIAHALDRRLYEAHDEGTPEKLDDDSYSLEWSEGDPFPGDLDQDQQNEVAGTGEAYWMFRNTFGRDSYDGKGARMVTVNNDPSIRCPNANWNGETTNYCTGVTSDDTVAHEWAHAYTEYTSGLVYQWQSGAMNEAYSDIWGETVDRLNDRFNETPDTRRRVGACSTHSPAIPVVEITSPASIARTCQAGSVSFGPELTETGTSGVVAVATDAADDSGPESTDACTTITNPAVVAGKIALVDRGTCAVVVKTKNAQDAGAIGVLVGDYANSPNSFSGVDATITIPTAVIGKDNRDVIAETTAAGTPVTVTMKEQSIQRDDSHRWLSGESDPAFGGAIRDMWNPTCYGDPGKVSDAEYKCSTDDSGGVHSNSGVVNHAYALLVDGGTYHDVEVPAIGLDKAANIFWRTQTAYLTPTSDFTDLADGLAASCADLAGEPINAVTVGSGSTGGGQQRAPAADPITAEDCAAVAAVSDAVELRLDPTRQCGFQPLLKKGAPSGCGRGFRTKAVFKEDFEDRLKGWRATEKAVYDGASGIPWRTAQAPGRRSSRAAFGPDPADVGSCNGSEDDVSSRNSIISPAVRVPQGTGVRMTFSLYVATEYGFDGGNVKVSVGKGDFKLPPADAFVFNGPNAELDPAPDGTSPLAGQPAWTGTNGGENNGSWGTTVVDLSKIAKTGQKLRFRFDMGRDGCGGLDGWYVDDVTVQICKVATRTVAAGRNGRPAKVAVKVQRAGTKGADPKGTVKLVKGKKTVGKATLEKGRAVAKVRGLRPGTHRLEVVYAATGRFARSTDKVTVKVRRR